MDIIILMKKDDPIARLDFDGKILKRFELYDKEQLPIGFINPAFPLEAGFRNIITNLDNWIKTRQIPNTREGYEEIKLKLNLKDMTNIIINNYGLSLNDSYNQTFKRKAKKTFWLARMDEFALFFILNQTYLFYKCVALIKYRKEVNYVFNTKTKIKTFGFKPIYCTSCFM